MGLNRTGEIGAIHCLHRSSVVFASKPGPVGIRTVQHEIEPTRGEVAGTYRSNVIRAANEHAPCQPRQRKTFSAKGRSAFRDANLTSVARVIRSRVETP